MIGGLCEKRDLLKKSRAVLRKGVLGGRSW